MGGRTKINMLSMMQRAGAGASRLSVQRAFHAAASSPGAFHVCQKALVPSVESGLLRQGGGLPRLFARRFARDTQRSRYANRKPAQTKVREREQEQWAQPPAQQAYGQLGRQEDEERGRQMDSLDDSGVRSHLTKVYATLGGTIGVSAFGSLGAMTIPGMMMSPLIPGLASLVPLFWLFKTTPDTHSEPFRGALLGSFALLSGMSTAPLIAMATSMNPMLVPMALGATTGMFGIMTLGAMVAPKGAALRMGPALFGGMIVIFGCGIGGMFVEPSSPWYPVLHSMHLYGGLGIFSLYVAYDTQQIISDYEEGNRDVMHGAVNLFINFKAMFSRFLFIFMGSKD